MERNSFLKACLPTIGLESLPFDMFARTLGEKVRTHSVERYLETY
jgi:hypothetical protein